MKKFNKDIEININNIADGDGDHDKLISGEIELSEN